MARIELTTNLRALLDRASTHDAFEVYGVGVGDAARDIPLALVESGRPHMAGMFQGSGQDARFARPGEEELRPYPVHEQLADVVEHGGDLRLWAHDDPRTTGAVVRVDGGQVTSIILLGPWLAALGLDTPAKAVRALGATEHRSRRHGWAKWLWPERGVAVTYRAEGLWSVTLAPEEEGCTFAAVDLVRWCLEWDAAHPGRVWPPAPHPASRSDAVLARRVSALLRAFGLGHLANPLASFFDGSFVGSWSSERIARLCTHLADPNNGLPRQLEPARHDRPPDPHDVERFWVRMLELRASVDVITRFNSGVLEAGWGLFLLSVELAGEVAGALLPWRDQLDRLLAFMLDPDGRRLPWGLLVREHGFPDEDFEELRSSEW